MNERARVSCVLGIVVQLRCFLVLFGASLCSWSAVENIENIVSPESGPEGGFARSRERITTHALDMVAKRAHAWTEYTCRCERVHASPIAGARARASRALFSSAAVVVRVGAAAVEDVHAEENHVAELVRA